MSINSLNWFIRLQQRYDVVTPNTNLALDLAKVKAHLRIDASDTTEDAWLNDKIEAARIIAEQSLERTLMDTTYDLVQNGFGGQDYIIVAFPPIQSITGVFTTDSDNNETEFDSSNYFLDTSSIFGRVIINEDAVWPVDLRDNQSVRVRYLAGYGPDNTTIPENYKQSMYEMIAFWYCRRTGERMTPDMNMDKILSRLYNDRIII